MFHPTPDKPHMCSSEAPDGAAQSYVSIQSSSPNTLCVLPVTLPHLAWIESWPRIQREELLIDSTQNSVRLKCVQARGFRKILQHSSCSLSVNTFQRSKSVNVLHLNVTFIKRLC